MNEYAANRKGVSHRPGKANYAQKSPTWAVATPLCAAFGRPTPTGAEGRYRPSGRTDLLALSLAQTAVSQARNFNLN
jgi:hypothetical protein